MKHWQPKTVLIAVFAFLLLAELGLVIVQARNQIFADTAQKTGSALMNFAQTRAERLQRAPNQSFEQYQLKISQENADTQSLYSKSYSAEVARLRDGFAHRGFTASDLQEFYREPGSAIAVRETGRALFNMGAQLRSESFPAMLKRWLQQARTKSSSSLPS